MRVSSYRITWRAPPVSTLSRVPASAPLSSARHWAAAQTLRTSAQQERLAIWLIVLIRAGVCTVIGEVMRSLISSITWCQFVYQMVDTHLLSVLWFTVTETSIALVGKTAPWRLQTGWGSPVVWTHEKVRSSAWSYERRSNAVYDSDRYFVESTHVCGCAFTGVRINFPRWKNELLFSAGWQ